MRLRHIATAATTSLLLAACGGADTESMQAGLETSGMDAARARCYTNALAEAFDAEAFNQVAAYLAQGDSFEEASTRARRKFGADFRQQLSAATGALAACGR